MAGSPSLSIKITATDQASKQIDQINKKIATISAPTDRLRKSFDRLADNTGLRNVGRGLHDMADSSQRLFMNLGRAIPKLGALAGIGSVAGMAELAKHYADFGSNLGFTAKQAGVSVPQLQQLGNAAYVAGGNFDGAAGAMADLNKNLELKKHGGQAPPEFTTGLMSMGVTQSSLQGKSTAQVMDMLLHKLAAMKNAQQQIYFGNAVLGSSFSSLWPLISQGTGALDQYQQQAAHMVGLTGAQSVRARELQGQMRRLGTDIEGVAMQIADGFAPGANNAAGAMAAWVEANKSLVAQDVHSWIKTVNDDMTALARRLNSLIAAENSWGKNHGAIIGNTDAQNNALRTQRENSLDAWMYQHLGIHTNLLGRAFGGASPTKAEDVTMDPTKKAFLDTIAGPESHGQYNRLNGTGHFGDYSKFPNVIGPGGISHAAGRYQFMPATWASVAKVLGLKDFGPQSQDKGAWQLAASAYRARTQRDLESDLKSGLRQPQIVDALKGIWPSLPGGSQQGESMKQFSSALAKNAALEAATPAAQAPPLGNSSPAPTGGSAEAVLASLRSQYPRGTASPPSPTSSGDDMAAQLANLRSQRSGESFHDRMQHGIGTKADFDAEVAYLAHAKPLHLISHHGNVKHTMHGKVEAHIKVDAPAGTKTSAVTSGPLFSGAPRVETMASGAP